MKTLFLSLALALPAPGVSGAGVQPPLDTGSGLPAAAVDMAKPPEVGPMKPYKMPPRQSWRMKNGLEVVLIEDRRLPLLTARLGFRAGQAALPAEDAGLASALAELLTDGTAKHSSKEISDAAENYGGTIDASSDADSLVLESYCLSEHADKMLSLMAEVAREASFPEKEVALRKKNMQEELNLSRSEPAFLASVAFYKKLFGAHPYGVTAPTDASIARLSRGGVVAAQKRLMTPKNAVLVLAGDLGRAAAGKGLERHFGSWAGPEGPAAAPQAEAFGAGVFLVDRPDSVQTALILGNAAVRETDPDYFNLLIANQVLGGSFSSRLVQDIREAKGYTYSIGSRVETRLAAGLFRIKTPVRNEVTGPALEGILGHLKRIREEAPAPAELEKAKSFLAGNFARSMETQQGVADAVLHQRLRGLPEDYYDRYVERVQTVKAGDALAAARAHIRPETMTLVAVGDAAKIKDVLAKFAKGPVIAVDKDGN